MAKVISSTIGGLLDLPARSRLSKCHNIADLRAAALQRAHRMVFDYIDGGADDEWTLRNNHSAFADIELHYKVLSGLEPPLDLSSSLFGHKTGLPFFACPTAGHRMFHKDAELAAARAARKYDTMFCLSALATTSLEDTAKETGDGPKLFQMYVWKGEFKTVFNQHVNLLFTN